jgi:hypothetical protein
LKFPSPGRGTGGGPGPGRWAMRITSSCYPARAGSTEETHYERCPVQGRSSASLSVTGSGSDAIDRFITASSVRLGRRDPARPGRTITVVPRAAIEADTGASTVPAVHARPHRGASPPPLSKPSRTLSPPRLDIRASVCVCVRARARACVRVRVCVFICA